jgi:hypothetical protein
MFGELNQSIELKLVGPPKKKMLNLCVLSVLLMKFHFYLFLAKPLKELETLQRPH